MNELLINSVNVILLAAKYFRLDFKFMSENDRSLTVTQRL